MNIYSCVADASRKPVGRRPFFVRIDGAKLLSVAAAELPLHGRALASPWTCQTLRSPFQTLHQLTRASRNPKIHATPRQTRTMCSVALMSPCGSTRDSLTRMKRSFTQCAHQYPRRSRHSHANCPRRRERWRTPPSARRAASPKEAAGRHAIEEIGLSARDRSVHSVPTRTAEPSRPPSRASRFRHLR